MQELHGFHSKYSREKAISIEPRVYATQGEKICLEFLPLNPKATDYKWEDWHCYRSILTIFREDYERLLIPYFIKIFPTLDPTNGKIQDFMDVCFDNWIGKEAWIKWLFLIQEDVQQKSNQEQGFYQEVCTWIMTVLTQTDVIVVDGNL